MFKKIIFLLFVFLTFGTSVYADALDIKPKGYITDEAQLLSSQSYALLEHISQVIEKKTGVEIAVLTLKTMESYTIEDFSVRVFEKWGIGKKGQDNGVLIVLAQTERKVRIEVGYGLEGVLPDGLCGQIIRQNMVPFFKQGDFNKGLLNGVVSVSSLIAKEYNFDLVSEIKASGYAGAFKVPGRKSALGKVIRLLFSLLILFLFISGRMGFLPFLFLGGMMGGRGGYWGNSDFRSGFGGGGFGGGGFGGGGFGGGMSGGGGASGGW